MPPDIGGRILDRRVPRDTDHIDKYNARRFNLFSESPAHVEKVLNIPRVYRDDYDQGVDGACVGFSQSWLMSTLNRKLYDAKRLYDEAQLIDEWDDTPPGEGTSLRAGFDVLRTKGHWRRRAGSTREVELDEGIERNVWLRSADEIRTAIAADKPVNLGINWYRNFSIPFRRPRLDDLHANKAVPAGDRRVRFDYWIGHTPVWGRLDGGHAITVLAWSDLRQSAGLVQTWGLSYPFLVWIPGDALDVLLRQQGEAAVVVDRVALKAA
jgi:hypothetical protein